MSGSRTNTRVSRAFSMLVPPHVNLPVHSEGRVGRMDAYQTQAQACVIVPPLVYFQRVHTLTLRRKTHELQ